MRNVNYSSKKTIRSVFVILALWTFRMHAAPLPPDPDNAALLYYQAFLLRPEPDNDTSISIDEVICGGEPDEKVREYLNLPDCRETIEFTEAATKLQQCNWGIRYSQGVVARLPQLVHIRNLSFLIYADARVLAADGSYKEAFNRCLAIQRIAEHVGDDTMISYFLSVSLNGLAHCCIQDILGSMPPDVDILIWLKDKLIMRGDIPSLVQALKTDEEMCIQSLRSNPDTLKRLREHLAENADDENTRKEILVLDDENFIAYVRKPNIDFLNSIFRVVESKMSYQEKLSEIQKISEVMNDEYDASHYVVADKIPEQYNTIVRNTAQFNTLKAAIDIYLIKAKTGQLPQMLSPGLPKDPYSGQDFGYEITKEGFTFHSQGEDFRELRGRLLEFKVKQ
jgi:hypothetical protein